MSLFLREDYSAYRRWVNVVPSVLISGSCQFLCGRKRAGLLWFLAIVALGEVFRFFNFAPLFKSIIPTVLAGAVFFFAWLLMIIDACRNPLPRLKWRTWTSLVCLAAAITLIPFLCVRTFALQLFSIPTGAMQPTLMGNRKTDEGRMKKGDKVAVSKWAYRFENPKRGDLMVFNTRGISSPLIQGDEFFVKRAVGIPGDTVSIHPPFVFINGEKLADPEIFKKMAAGSNGYSGYVCAGLLGTDKDEITLVKDEYLVLGDNSKNSLDGRYFGPIKRESIIGKVTWIYWPPERRGRPE
jgi:signal peptidase I